MLKNDFFVNAVGKNRHLNAGRYEPTKSALQGIALAVGKIHARRVAGRFKNAGQSQCRARQNPRQRMQA